MSHFVPDNYGQVIGIVGKFQKTFKKNDFAVWQAKSIYGRSLKPAQIRPISSREVDEYVITREISNKLADFFEMYNDPGETNGVWISGFFGSGKSHLLKILSYVLENKQYNGIRLGELFAEKIKDDVKLKGDLLGSLRKIHSESILFNIDQQAQITSKSDESAILKVFYKVFYDHQGFYGFQPHVAAFEESLFRGGRAPRLTRAGPSALQPWTEAEDTLPRSTRLLHRLAPVYIDNPENYKDYLT